MWISIVTQLPLAVGLAQVPATDAPEPAPSVAERVLDAVAQNLVDEGPREWPPGKFDELLEEARVQTTRTSLDPLGAQVLDGLLEAAEHRAAYPDLWEALQSRYFRPATDGPRARTAPRLRPQDASPESRVAWEYLLLAPGPRLPLSSRRATQALGWIADEASLPVLSFAYRATCSGDSAIRTVIGMQSWLLEAMARMASEPAIVAITDALLLSEQQKSRQPRDPLYDAETSLGQLLELWVDHGAELGDRWRSLLGSQLAVELDSSQAAVLDRLRSRIG